MSNARLAVLVVDDVPLIREMLREYLETDDYLVATSEKHISLVHDLTVQPPGLLIIDLRFATVCIGWTIIVALRGHPQTKYIPIVAMSADRAPSAEQAAMLAHLRVTFIMKPIMFEDLISAITTAQALVQRTRAVGESGAAEDSPNPLSA